MYNPFATKIEYDNFGRTGRRPDGKADRFGDSVGTEYATVRITGVTWTGRRTSTYRSIYLQGHYSGWRYLEDGQLVSEGEINRNGGDPISLLAHAYDARERFLDAPRPATTAEATS